MKLNLGCGFDRRDGYINVDNQRFCEPDTLADLEVFPWPFETSSATEILLSHVLEHLGEKRDTYLKIIQELYRVSAPDAVIKISVPHPRHDDFLNDPTHVRAITADQFFMFSKKQNDKWRNEGAANTLLAKILDVDFEVTDVQSLLNDVWLKKLKSRELSIDELTELATHQVNIIQEITIQLRAVK